MGEVKVWENGEAGFATTRFEDLLAWARKYSLFQYPFATACCGMEFFSVASSRYDIGAVSGMASFLLVRRGCTDSSPDIAFVALARPCRRIDLA